MSQKLLQKTYFLFPFVVLIMLIIVLPNIPPPPNGNGNSSNGDKTIIWEWDRTYKQIQDHTYPDGFAHHIYEPQIIAGKWALEFKAEERIPGNGRFHPTLAIYVLRDWQPKYTSFWKTALFYVPSDFDIASTTSDDKGWWTPGGTIAWMYEAEPWSSGGIQFSQFASDLDNIRVRGSYRLTPLGEKIDAGYHPTFRLKRGQWHEWVSYAYVDETNGRVTHWIDGEQVFDFQNICTDPSSVGATGPRAKMRLYVDGETNFPQSIWLAEFSVWIKGSAVN